MWRHAVESVFNLACVSLALTQAPVIEFAMTRIIPSTIAVLISIGAVVILPATSQAGQKSVYIGNSGAVYSTGNYRSSRQTKVRKFQSQRNHRAQRRFNGPLVINIRQVLANRKNKGKSVVDNSNRHIIEGIGGSRVLFYDESQCDNGYDCTIRLGGRASSPKIIVIGKKRKIDEGAGPHIIYPPS